MDIKLFFLLWMKLILGDVVYFRSKQVFFIVSFLQVYFQIGRLVDVSFIRFEVGLVDCRVCRFFGRSQGGRGQRFRYCIVDKGVIDFFYIWKETRGEENEYGNLIKVVFFFFRLVIVFRMVFFEFCGQAGGWAEVGLYIFGFFILFVL